MGNILAGGLGLIIGFALVLVVLFPILIMPVWSILDVALDSSRSGLSKTLWIVSILFFWMLGAAVYVVVGANSKALRICGLLSVVLVIGLGVLAVNNPNFRSEFQKQLEQHRLNAQTR